MSLSIYPLPYFKNSALLFRYIRDLPWAVFLDSGRMDSALSSQQGRYDILSAKPYITLTTIGALTTIQTAENTITSSEDPLNLLRKYLGDRIETHASLPFTGGAIGYFSYDLARRLEFFSAIAQADIALPEMMMGIYDWAIIVDHQTASTQLVAQHRDQNTKSFCESLIKRINEIEVMSLAEKFCLTTPLRSCWEQSQYAAAFTRVKNYLRAGDCYQVNLSQRFQGEFEGSPWVAYEYLRQKNPSPYAAYLQYPEITILSLSPERFLQVVDGQVQTKPIKGTRPRGHDVAHDRALAEELLHSEKDRAENLMIVDLLRNDLNKHCQPHSVKVDQLFALESFPQVHHLVSTIRGKLNEDKDSLDLLHACFPGGSITGAPKLRAMQIIEELEPYRRGLYCGAVGYVSFDGNMDTNIAIRTVTCIKNTMFVSAGGGLVADSICEEEYEEINAKVGKIIAILEEGIL